MTTPKRPAKSTRTPRARKTTAKPLDADRIEDAELAETPPQAPAETPDVTLPGESPAAGAGAAPDRLPAAEESIAGEDSLAGAGPESADPAGTDTPAGNADGMTASDTLPGDPLPEDDGLSGTDDTLPGDAAPKVDLPQDAAIAGGAGADGVPLSATADATADVADPARGDVTGTEGDAAADLSRDEDAPVPEDERYESATDAATAAAAATAAMATTPWGGAPADITARSTADPASPAYVPPAAERAPGRAAEEDYHEEGGSVAGRILFWLFLLVLGAALILWAGPKIAPSLPSGLAPVAEWLTPGQRAARMELEELEARIDARLAELDTGLTPETVDARIAAAVEESEGLAAQNLTALGDEVNALSDQVAASDSAPIEERLSRMETRVEGLIAELSALRSDLTGLAAGEGGITGQNAQEIDAFSAALAGVQAELDTLAARTGAQDQRIDEVAATAERQLRTAREEIAAAEAAAEAEVARASEQADMVSLANALDTGAPFVEPLAGLAEQTEIPEPLPRLAETGIATQAELEASFPDLAHQAIRADLSPDEGEGLLSGATSFLRARTAGRSLVEREGTDADAVLSRVEARLRRGDLGAALDEAEQLSDRASERMTDWVADLRARHDALTAYRTLAERLDAGN